MNDIGDLMKELKFILKLVAWIACILIVALDTILPLTSSTYGSYSQTSVSTTQLFIYPNGTPSYRQLPSVDEVNKRKDAAEAAAKNQLGNGGVAGGLGRLSMLSIVAAYGYFTILLVNIILNVFTDMDTYTESMILGIGGLLNVAACCEMGIHVLNTPLKHAWPWLIYTIAALASGIALIGAAILQHKELDELGDMVSFNDSSNRPFGLSAIALILHAVTMALMYYYTIIWLDWAVVSVFTLAFYSIVVILAGVATTSFLFASDEPDDIVVAGYLGTSGVMELLVALYMLIAACKYTFILSSFLLGLAFLACGILLLVAAVLQMKN